MPNLDKRSKNKASEPKKKKASEPKKSKRKVTSTGDDADDVIVPGVTPTEEPEVKAPSKKVALAKPFSDGVVSVSLLNVNTVSRIGGADVDFLKEFLKYFSMKTTFGNLATRTSFMKNTKGSRLL